MSRTNREWHLANRMPPHATREQRAQWHFEHAKACGCRTPSAAEEQLIEEHRSRLELAGVLDHAPEAVE